MREPQAKLPLSTMKYNPGFLSDDDLEAQFVVREYELTRLLEIVGENTRTSNQHVIIIGPRGYGKTTLARRLAVEARKRLGTLWIPIVFSEEAFEVYDAASFWHEALFYLSKEIRAPALKSAYDDLKRERDAEVLRTRALALLTNHARASSKRLLIIVENLQQLLDEQLSSQEAWSLRKTLSDQSEIMLLGTATSRLSAIEDEDQAMYAMFLVIELEPLRPRECARLFKTLTGEPVDLFQGRALQIMTGGNPRLLVVLSRFARGQPLHELLRDFTRLIDDHTDYFKSNIEALPSRERRVFVTLAGLWSPAPAREIADAARMDVNNTSALLKRLERRGAVTARALNARRKQYQVAERLYNLYYLMRRHGEDSEQVRYAVNFIAAYYSVDELTTKLLRFADQATALGPDERSVYIHGFLLLFNKLAEHSRLAVIIHLSRPFLDLLPPPERSALESAKHEALHANTRFREQVVEFIAARPFIQELIELIEQKPLFAEFIRWLDSPEARQGRDGPWERSENWFPRLFEELGQHVVALRALVKRASAATSLSRIEALLMAGLAVALGRPRSAIAIVDRLVDGEPDNPWLSCGQLLVKASIRKWSSEKLLKQQQRLAERFDSCWWLPLPFAVYLALNGRHQPARLLFERGLPRARIESALEFLLEIRVGLLEAEEEIVQSPSLRHLVPLTLDETWEDMLAFLAQITRDMIGNEEYVGAIYERAGAELPASSRLHLLRAHHLLALPDPSRDFSNELHHAATLKPDAWQTHLALGASFGLYSDALDDAVRHCLTSWKSFLHEEGCSLTPAERVITWLRLGAKRYPELKMLTAASRIAGLQHLDCVAMLKKVMRAKLKSFTQFVGSSLGLLCLCVAKNRTKLALRVMQKSPYSAKIRPIIVATRKLLGEELIMPEEIAQVANDIRRQLVFVEAVASAIRDSTA